jgi:hypothetical protein
MVNKEEIANFSLTIERFAQEKQTSYMDAIVLYCEKTGLEVEIAAKLISNALKSKIKTEAENLHFIPKSKTRKLPI